jgi:mannosyltransferase OCH1-like enzyme
VANQIRTKTKEKKSNKIPISATPKEKSHSLLQKMARHTPQRPIPPQAAPQNHPGPLPLISVLDFQFPKIV